jgi:outer membrane protein TolC
MRLLRILGAVLIGGLTVTPAQAADRVDDEIQSSSDERSVSAAYTGVALSRDQAVDQALAQNPGFLALKRQVDVAYAKREQADGFESPTIYWEFEEANRSNASGIGSQVIGIEQSFEWFGVRSARKELADLGIEATRALVERGRLRLTARVLKAYDHVLLTDSTLRLLERMVSLNKEAVNISRTRFKAGESQYVDLMRTRLQRNQLQNELLAAQTAAAGAQRVLKRLLGQESEGVQLAGALSYEPLLKQDKHWLQRLEQQGPTFALLDRRIRQAEQQLQIARKGRYPEITFGIGQQRLNDGINREDALAGQLSFKFPLPGSDRQSGLEAEAVAERYAVTDQANAQRIEVRSVFSQSLKVAHTLEKQIQDYQAVMLPDAEDQLKAARQAYRLGRIDALNLLDIYSTYSEIQQSYLETLVRYRAVITDLQTLGEALWEVEL